MDILSVNNEAKLSGVEPASRLARNIFQRKEEFLAELSTADFYAQIFLIAIIIAISLLMAKLVTKRIVAHLNTYPPKRIDTEFLTKPLALLPSILCLIYLGIFKPIADDLSFRNGWVDAAIDLSFAYFWASCVLLIIKTRFLPYCVLVALLILPSPI
jgi:hypothetical protein